MPVTRTQANSANAAKATSSNANTSNKESTNQDETSVEAEQQRRESPDNCSICLGPFNNKSFTSSCAHSFCFICLKQWSKVKAECPLCKQPFTSIFHNIRSDQSYDIYELPTLQPSRHNGFEFYFPSSLTTFSAHSHPYLSLAQPGLDADLTLSNFSRFQFRHRRYDRYLQHPVQGEHQYSFLFNPATHVSAVSWPRGAEDFRRAVYKHRLGPPLFILGNETSNYHLTPAMVNASAHRLQRIMPWLTRELKVLLKSHQSVRLAISVIQPLLSQVLIDSPHFSEKVSPLIGRKARQFIQEFIAFANSALTIQAFDRKAIYFRQDTSTLLLDNSSSRSSSDDDDIVEITDVSSDPEIIGPISPVAGGSGLLRAGWNSPTPGPSWENLGLFSTLPNREIETVSVSSESDDPVFRPDLIDSDSSSKAGSDIVFLKYDKPWTERSPIRLSSSDSDNERKSRKRSKHKRKKREHSAAGDHKSGRLKPSEIPKQKTTSDEEASLLQETSIALKNRVHSSSSEKQKRKKKKKNRDRELVDRLFAQALSNKLNSPRNIDLDDGPSSSKTTDNIGKSSHVEKSKRKHKKKDRKRSRDSQSSSNMHSYKKHHSGHKKSGDKNPQPESGRKKHRSKHKGQGDNIPGGSNESESLCWDPQLLRPQPLQSQSIVGHNNFGQPNYLPVPDTLQHIPLNLWVSAWPAIPTSHAFSGAPPSSTFLSSSLPLSSNSALKSNALLSESSSETDTDDTEDYSISSETTCTRTKQWLDSNFQHSKKGTVNSPKATASKNIWQMVNSHATQAQNPCQGTSSTLKNVVNVVSVSDDEDVVVCSGSGTSSSSKSDYDYDVQVRKDLTQNNCHSTNITSTTSCPPCTSANQKRDDTKTDSDLEQTSETINLTSTTQHEFVKTLSNNENVIVNQLGNPIAPTQENTHYAENGNQMPINCLASNYVSAPLEQAAESVICNFNAPLAESSSTYTSQGVFDTDSINLSTSQFNASPLTSSSKPFQPHCAPLNLTLNSVPPLKNAIFSNLFQPHSASISKVASISNSTTSKTSSPKGLKSKNVLSFAVDEILSNSDCLSTDLKSRNESVNFIEENPIAAASLDQQRTYNLDASTDYLTMNDEETNIGKDQLGTYNLDVSSDSLALNLPIPNDEETNNGKDQLGTYNLDVSSDSLALNLPILNDEETNNGKDQLGTYNLDVSSDSLALNLPIPNDDETTNDKDQLGTYNLDVSSDSLALNLPVPNDEERNNSSKADS